MAKKPLPCPTMLRLLLDYNPETGSLAWKPRKPWMFPGGKSMSPDALARRWNTRWAGAESLCKRDDGYVVGNVRGSACVYGHRVAWAISHGEWPEALIDHCDGNPSNNALANLRQASRTQNARNAVGKGGTSKFKGVSWCKSRKAWRAQIRHGGKKVDLGRFASEFEAGEAYRRAAIMHHGEFAKY